MSESLWLDEFRRYDFTFEGRDAVVVLPPKAAATPRWMLKTEYFGAFPELETQLLRKGYYLAYLKNLNRFGCDEDQDAKARFASELKMNFGLYRKCVAIGMSCGGAHAVKLAARHPEMVSVLYLDAPVLNYLSWPFGLGGKYTDAGVAEQTEMLRACGLDKSTLISYRAHPLDKIPALIANKIPVVMVYGDSDRSVPYEENGYLLEKAYRNAGTNIAVFPKKGCGHHPHGLEDPTPVIDFILKYDK